jgi:hypothetical protein
MAERLEGLELRVFRSLFEEYDLDSIEEIRVQLTRGALASATEIETALASLRERGYVEELRPGHWRVAPQGLGVRRSLLGEFDESDQR